MITGIALCALLMASGAAHAATYVYVSNAEDGDIGLYAMEGDGTLKPGDRTEAGKLVMPMSVSPDKRFLFESKGSAVPAASRASPRMLRG